MGNRDGNCGGRKSGVTCEQIERTGGDIVGRNVVRDIDNLRGGIDGEDRALHRADEIILRAKISQESDNRHEDEFTTRTQSHKVNSSFFLCVFVSLRLILGEVSAY